MKVEQFVMAYAAEQDRIRAILPDGFESFRTAENAAAITCRQVLGAYIVRFER